jgi:hypothetical protein
MKKSLLSFILGVCLSTIFAFKAFRYEPNISTAEVSKIEGFYIFTDSKPVMPYDSLGVVELGFVNGTQYESIRANLVKRARKKYADADGLILYLNKKDIDKCLVVRFK